MKIAELEALFFKVNQFDQHLGLKLKILGPGQIEYRLHIQDIHLSSPGVAHGGVMGAMMDCVLGATALSYAVTQDQFCSTVEYKTNFLRPARLGDELLGTGAIEYKGQSLVVVRGQINCQTETLALGLGTFNLYPLDKKNIQAWS